MEIIKEAVGIDVSKDSIDVRFGKLLLNQDQQITESAKFDNNPKGFKELIKFAKSNRTSKDIPLYFAMEATGVYYENLAYFLSEKHLDVIVILPNKVKNYSKTLENKSKTDKLDSLTITKFALERKMQTWQLPSPLTRQLKALSREYNSIKQMTTQVKNQIHAKEFSHEPLKQSLKRSHTTLAVFEKQLKEIEKQIKELIKDDDDLNNKIKKIDLIEGVGFMTIISVIAETNGFALIKSNKQLTSYAGLDIVENQSGLKKGKTTISKKGNSNLRKALYMPALSASRFNPKLHELYIRLLTKKSNKKVALIAVARKLLILIYTIFKNNVDYVPNYNPAKSC